MPWDRLETQALWNNTQVDSWCKNSSQSLGTVMEDDGRQQRGRGQVFFVCRCSIYDVLSPCKLLHALWLGHEIDGENGIYPFLVDKRFCEGKDKSSWATNTSKDSATNAGRGCDTSGGWHVGGGSHFPRGANILTYDFASDGGSDKQWEEVSNGLFKPNPWSDRILLRAAK